MCDECLPLAAQLGDIDSVVVLGKAMGNTFSLFTVIYQAITFDRPALLRWCIATHGSELRRNSLLGILDQIHGSNPAHHGELRDVISGMDH